MLIEKVSDENQIEIVAGLADEIWNEYFTAIIGKPQVDYMLAKFQSIKAIKQQIDTGFLYFLIKNNSDPVGYLAVLPETGRLFLSKFYILSSERGKGYGSETIAFLENMAIDNGVRKISLTVNKNNLATISLYKKFGFTNCGSVVQDIGQAFVMDDYIMEKDVSDVKRTL